MPKNTTTRPDAFHRRLTEKRPYFSAFLLDLAFPAAVLGPVDFFAFLLLAFIFFFDVCFGLVGIFFFLFPSLRFYGNMCLPQRH